MSSQTALACVLVAGLAGCGGETSVKISRTPSQRPDIDAPTAARGALRLPGDQPFNLTSFTSGQTGPAAGESRASDKGAANASARAEAGGTAWAEFQVGYCFDNTSGHPLDGVLRLRTDSATTITGSGENGRNKATIIATFVVKNSDGTSQHSETLTDQRSRSGPNTWSGEQEVAFESRFRPGLGYYLFVAVRVEAEAKTGEQSAEFDLKSCELEIEWRPARESAPSASTAPAAAGQ